MAQEKRSRGIALPHLAAWRQRRYMTQRDLAAAAGVTQKSIALLETGEHAARVATIDKLASALNISRDELVEGPEKREAPTVATSERQRRRAGTTPKTSTASA